MTARKSFSLCLVMRTAAVIGVSLAFGGAWATPAPLLTSPAECKASDLPCACPAGGLRQLPQPMPDAPAAALAALRRAGFEGPRGVRVVYRPVAADRAGLVLSSNPAAGVRVCGPVTVRLVVGVAQRWMPAVKTLSLPEALHKLQEALPGQPAPQLMACGRSVELTSAGCSAEFDVEAQWPMEGTPLPSGNVPPSLRLSRRVPATGAMQGSLVEARAALSASNCPSDLRWKVTETALPSRTPADTGPAAGTPRNVVAELLDVSACSATLLVANAAEAPPQPPGPAPGPTAPLVLGALGGVALARLGIRRSGALPVVVMTPPGAPPPAMRVVIERPF